MLKQIKNNLIELKSNNIDEDHIMDFANKYILSRI